jgi:hypothetical protein
MGKLRVHHARNGLGSTKFVLSPSKKERAQRLSDKAVLVRREIRGENSCQHFIGRLQML